jgi:hypothetical protein
MRWVDGAKARAAYASTRQLCPAVAHRRAPRGSRSHEPALHRLGFRTIAQSEARYNPMSITTDRSGRTTMR